MGETDLHKEDVFMMRNYWYHLRAFRYGIAMCLFSILALCSTPAFVHAAGDNSSDDDGLSEKIEESLAQKRALSPLLDITTRISKAIPKPTLPAKAMVRQVNISGSTILAREAIEQLKKNFEGKELSARQMQNCADMVTRAYSREGYITSYAYIVPDKLDSGILDILVAEGKTGRITIEGNKYFSTDVLEKKITLKEGDLFNFRKLNKDVFRMNKHMDRKAKISCSPDMQNRVTDVTITVKDKNPVHTMLQYDNYGSEYIGYRRYKVFVIHNNITGHDDTLQWKYQRTEANSHILTDFDYTIPLNPSWKFNFYIMPYKKENYLCGDNQTYEFEKHAWKWYFWFKQWLIDEPDCELISSYGFVYKQINWYKYGGRQAQDHFRSVEWQLDLNRADRYGRWVASHFIEQGLPHLMGGADDKEDRTSVAGAHGNYLRNHLTVARRQKIWNGIDFIAKGHWQESSQRMTGVNVFSMGGFMGVIDNRGYPRAQFPGDRGRSLTGGFSVPLYFLSRTSKVPGSNTTWFDGLRFFNFVDYAVGVLKRTPDDHDREATLVSTGVGMLFNVPDKSLSMRLDCAWPVSNTKPKDGDGHHILYTVTKAF